MNATACCKLGADWSKVHTHADVWKPYVSAGVPVATNHKQTTSVCLVGENTTLYTAGGVLH